MDRDMWEFPEIRGPSMVYKIICVRERMVYGI